MFHDGDRDATARMSQTLYMHARGDIAYSNQGIFYSPYSAEMTMSKRLIDSSQHERHPAASVCI